MKKTKEALQQELDALKQEYAALKAKYEKKKTAKKGTKKTVVTRGINARKQSGPAIEVLPEEEKVEQNQSLEELVVERTSQISEANDELHKANANLAREIAKHRLTEYELRKSEQKYRQLIEGANEAIVVIQNGFLKLLNPATLAMTGYTQEEIVKIPFTVFIHPEDREHIVENHKRRLAGENIPNHYVFRLLRKDGSTCWVYMNAVLIDWEGSPATLNMLTDITEAKLAEYALKETNSKLEAIISASPDGIGIITLDAKLQFASDKLLQIYGYSKEDSNSLLGRSVLDFIDESNHDYMRENILKLIRGESDHKIRDYIAIRKDESRFYVEINYALLPDSDGRPIGILCIQRDCTERIRAREEVEKINLELAELNATKDKFFSIIAHDLKSPFQGLIGCSQILSHEFDTLSEDEKISFIRSIEELSRNSYRLLENLLDWSRIQTGQMVTNLEDFNLLIELYPTISLIKQTAKNKNIKFDYSIDNSIFVRADRNMLSAIIRNLAANSIKFTNPGGKISLSAKKVKGIVEISVTDSGVGIEKEILNKLFKIDKSVTRKGTANEQGTGLGLLLCREMVEKHKGKIRVESEVGKGSTFTFTLNSSL